MDRLYGFTLIFTDEYRWKWIIQTLAMSISTARRLLEPVHQGLRGPIWGCPLRPRPPRRRNSPEPGRSLSVPGSHGGRTKQRDLRRSLRPGRLGEGEEGQRTRLTLPVPQPNTYLRRGGGRDKGIRSHTDTQ